MPSQSSAPMNFFININGKVVRTQSSGFVPQLVVLTKNSILPTNTPISFNSASAVFNYFGNSYNTDVVYTDYNNAVFYFNGTSKTQMKPSSILFYRYIDEHVDAYTRGTSLSLTSDFADLLLVTAGTLNVTFNGTVYSATGIDLHLANSFNAMATIIQTQLRATALGVNVSCKWDSITKAFTISNAFNSSNANTVGYITNSGTGSTDKLAQKMKITQSIGAILSQGSDVLTPAQNMDNLVNLTNNFATIICNFDINSDNTYATILGLTAWNNSQKYLYLLMCYDTQNNKILPTSPIIDPMQTALINAGWGQSSVPPYTFNTQIMYIICSKDTIGLPFAVSGVLASINFSVNNGMIALNACTFAGISPIITNENDLNTLVNIYGANSYCNLNTRNNNYKWFETGVIGGNYGYADTIIGYMWLADQIQVTLANTMQSLKSIPYNQLSIINAVIEPIFVQGLYNGCIQNNIPLSNPQKQELIQQAGYDFTPILYNKGYYFPQVTASPEDISTRTLSNVNAWYTFAGSPIKINVNLTTVL